MLFKKFKMLFPALIVAVLVTGCSSSTTETKQEEGVMTPGVYSITANGCYGEFSIDVTVDETSIQAVEITETHDSKFIGQRAQENVAANVVANQSTQVDGLSGATISTNAMKNAVRKALTEAGATADMFTADCTAEAKQNCKGDISEFEPDVIIVGVGISGLTAALTAADSGAKVLMIEQNSYFGGSTMYSGGYVAAAGSTTLDDMGYVTDANEFAEWLSSGDTTTFRTDLAQVVALNSGKALDMLTKYGAKWQLGGNIGLNVGAHANGQSSQTIENSDDTFAAYVIAEGSRGLGIFETTEDSVQNFVAEGQMAYLLDTRVDSLVTNDAGDVVGVKVEDGTEYKAPAVILCAGGYSNNTVMLEELYTRYAHASADTSTGTLIESEVAAGAVLHDMDTTRVDGGTLPILPFGATVYRELAYKTPGLVWLNTEGKRFIKEGSSASSAYVNTDQNTIYMLMNQELIDSQNVLYYGNYATYVMDENNEELNRLAEAENCVYKGDTIEEAAKKAGLDPEVVANELKTYNEYCATGEDLSFGKGADALISMEEGPYYIVETIPNVKTTNGGVVIDTNGRVMDANNEPIKGLYAAGETAGNVDMANPLASYYGANLHRGATIGYTAALTAVEDMK